MSIAIWQITNTVSDLCPGHYCKSLLSGMPFTAFLCRHPHFSVFHNERRSSKGNALFPIWALSHGINSHTLYALLQQNPSSKLNSKPHYSSQPMDQTSRKKYIKRFRCQLHPYSASVDLSVSMHACYTRGCLHMCVCVCAVSYTHLTLPTKIGV